MGKRLENPRLSTFFKGLLTALLLCFPLTLSAEDAGKTTPGHSDSEEKKTNPAVEKFRENFAKVPAPLLSELTKSLLRAKSDISNEDFDKLVEEALKKSDPDSEEAKASAEEIKKGFKEEKDALGENPASELGEMAAEEMSKRLADKPGAEPSTTPPSSTASTSDAKPTDGKKPGESELEKIRKELADMQDLAKKLEDSKKASGDKKGLEEALKGLGGKNGGGGESGGSPKSGGDSGGGSPPPSNASNEDSGEKNTPPEQPQTAGDKLRALADLLSNSSNSSDSTETASNDSGDEEEESTGSSKRSKSEDTSSSTDSLLDAAKSLSPEVAQELPPPVSDEPMGPQPLPAKTALPTIPSGGGGAMDPSMNAGLNGAGNSGGGMMGGFGGGSMSSTTTSSSSFTDTAFASVGGGGGAPGKKVNYKYLRVGAEAYGSSGGGGSESSVGEGSGYGSGKPSSVDGIWMAPAESSTASGAERGVFSYVTKAVEGLCSGGSLSCQTPTEKQP